jgi:proteasome lid subunit RPN8/RPN11
VAVSAGKQVEIRGFAFGSYRVLVTAEVRAALVAHANAELPNEACGLVLLEGDTAVEYVPGRNALPSPYHFELEIDPVTWADLNDRDGAQAVFHSHLSSPPRPSRTDVQNIGLWEGQPYLIYTVRTGELAAWRIEGAAIVSVPIEAA